MLFPDTLVSFSVFFAAASTLSSWAMMLTSSPRERWRTTSANAKGTGSNLPGQSDLLWGHAIQVAAWGSHSAGMRKVLLPAALSCGEGCGARCCDEAEAVRRAFFTDHRMSDAACC